VSSASEPTQPAGPGWQEDGPRVCPIADALQLVGDRYALLILRELEFGVRRFSDIRHNTGAPRETLSARLRKLEDAGLITRQRYSEHPPRDEYVPTDAGSAITPVLQSLRRWGEQHAAAGPPHSVSDN
jgi:DNA-binding HxlR family transcriptional regulator